MEQKTDEFREMACGAPGAGVVVVCLNRSIIPSGLESATS